MNREIGGGQKHEKPEKMMGKLLQFFETKREFLELCVLITNGGRALKVVEYSWNPCMNPVDGITVNIFGYLFELPILIIYSL